MKSSLLTRGEAMMLGCSFLKAFSKGLAIIVGACSAFVFALQVVYGLGWYLYSVMPKHGERSGTDIFGEPMVILADLPTPQSVWLFASDSLPFLLGLGLLLLFVIALASFFVMVIALIGGWQAPPRVRLMFDLN